MPAKKTAIKSSHTKRELKKELEGKIESALPEIKIRLGEKKFQQRVKKAAKIFAHGLHSKDLSENSSKPGETGSEKVKALKKAKSKKS